MRETRRTTRGNKILSIFMSWILAFGCCGGAYFTTAVETASALPTPVVIMPTSDQVRTVAKGDTLALEASAAPSEETDYLKYQWYVKNADATDGEDFHQVPGFDEMENPVPSGSGSSEITPGRGEQLDISYNVPTNDVGRYVYYCEFEQVLNQNISYTKSKTPYFYVTVTPPETVSLPSDPTIENPPIFARYGEQIAVRVEQKGALVSTNGKFAAMKISVAQPTSDGSIVFDYTSAKISIKRNGGETELPTAAVAINPPDPTTGSIDFTFNSDYLANIGNNAMPYDGESYVIDLIGTVTRDVSVLKAKSENPPSPGTADAIIQYSVNVTTTYTPIIEESGETPTVRTLTASRPANLRVSMPVLEIQKTVLNNPSNTTNIGTEQSYCITVTNKNSDVPVSSFTVTDEPQQASALGLDIAVSDVYAVERNGSDIKSNVTITKINSGFQVDFGSECQIRDDVYTIKYKMVSGDTSHYNTVLSDPPGISNQATVTGTNVFDPATATALLRVMVPTASAVAQPVNGGPLSTSEYKEVTVNFYMAGSDGVELINPTFELSKISATGTATITDAKVNVMGQQGSFDLSNGLVTVPARIVKPAEPATIPIATVTYKVKAPEDASGSNGNVSVIARMGAENLASPTSATTTFTIAIPTATISATASPTTPSASSNAVNENGEPAVPPTTVGIKVVAQETADYAQITEPMVTIIDKASDATKNPVAAKFKNLVVKYDGTTYTPTIYQTETEFNTALQTLRNTNNMIAYIDMSGDATLRVASGVFMSQNKELVITYDDEMVTGPNANGGTESIDVMIYNYTNSTTGNLVNDAHGSAQFTLQEPSMEISEELTDPDEDDALINFGDTASFKTVFNKKNPPTYPTAEVKDYSMEVAIDDVTIGVRTYTPAQVGLTIKADSVTIKNSAGEDVADNFNIAFSDDYSSFTIYPKDPAATLSNAETTVEYSVLTDASAQYADQLRGAQISVTSTLRGSNVRVEAVSPSASVSVADASLGINKRAAHYLVKKGETDKYTITIANTYEGGYSKARGLTVTDELDSYTYKFGYSIVKKSLRVSLGGANITDDVVVQWKGTRGFTLDLGAKDLVKGSNLIITYNATTASIPIGSYSQDLSNTAMVSAVNAKPAVALCTVSYNGKSVDQVPSTSGDLLPVPGRIVDEPIDPGTGGGSGNNGTGSNSADNGGDNGSSSSSFSNDSNAPSANDNPLLPSPDSDGQEHDDSLSADWDNDDADDSASAASASNDSSSNDSVASSSSSQRDNNSSSKSQNSSKTSSPAKMNSTGDVVPYALAATIIGSALLAAALFFIRRKNR